MTKTQAVRLLQDQGRDLSFIANVFLTGGGPNAAKTLKAVASLVRQGHQVGTASFRMPYEIMLVDGSAKTPEEVRQMAELSYAK